MPPQHSARDGPLGVSDLFAAPVRRNLRDLSQALEKLATGDPVSVLFRTKRYGIYRIVGKATWSDVHGALAIAGETLGVAGRPSSAIVRIDSDPVYLDPHTICPAAASQILHGDLISARFECFPYGEFVIAGHAVALGERMTMLGGWLVSVDGKEGRALRAVHQLRQEGTSAARPPRASILADDYSVDAVGAT